VQWDNERMNRPFKDFLDWTANAIIRVRASEIRSLFLKKYKKLVPKKVGYYLNEFLTLPTARQN